MFSAIVLRFSSLDLLCKIDLLQSRHKAVKRVARGHASCISGVMNQVVGLGISSIAKKKRNFEIPLRVRACLNSSIMLGYLGRAANGYF
jgi:hypothetical protein